MARKSHPSKLLMQTPTCTVKVIQLIVCSLCTDIFLGGGGRIDAFKRHMYASEHPLGFCKFYEIVEIFKDKNRQIQL